jgi:hypothetical protein
MPNLNNFCESFLKLVREVQETNGPNRITDEMRDLICGQSAESMPSLDKYMQFRALHSQCVNFDKLRTDILNVARYINTKSIYLRLWNSLTLFDFDISAISHLLNVDKFVLSLNAEHPELSKILFRIINGIVEHPEFSEFCRQKREEESSEESEEESEEEPKFFSFEFLNALQKINAYYRQNYAPIRAALDEN